MDFENKNYLIIGASSGIGADLSKKLLEVKANVYTASRTKPGFITNFSEFDAQNPTNTFLNILPETLSGLVYCPGTINLKPANRLTLNDFKNDFQINFLGLVFVFNAVLEKLKKSGNSSVISFSTVAAKIGMPYHASVAASKAALEGFTKSIAAEFANQNLRANCIAPSLTNSSLVKSLLSTPEKRELSAKRHPLGRIGQPNEIAALASFLLTDDASWITGQTFQIDGGLSSIKI